ncbi:hypothetical protein ACFPM0_00860 [Pseudonocardia sulfidoxydans]
MVGTTPITAGWPRRAVQLAARSPIRARCSYRMFAPASTGSVTPVM